MAKITKDQVIDWLNSQWGVAIPVAGAAAEIKKEKTEFDVILTPPGDNKINVIKEVRAITGMELKKAKELVDRG